MYYNNNNIQHMYSTLKCFTIKRCCEYYRIDSDFINLGYINLKMSSVYQVHAKTHNGIHNDKTQPTRCNSNKCK